MTTRVRWAEGEYRIRRTKGRDIREMRYPALCESCGETRWLARADARRAEAKGSVCFQCSQVIKAKLGYKKCVELHGNDFAIRAVQRHHLAKPSLGEQALIAALDAREVAYEREVLLPDGERRWLIDFVVNGVWAIEYNGGCHVLHGERDLYKANDIRTAGFRLLVLDETDLPHLGRILDDFLGGQS